MEKKKKSLKSLKSKNDPDNQADIVEYINCNIRIDLRIGFQFEPGFL